MAGSKSREETSLELDWDVIDACNGFTLDFGGSVMKLVYISQKDWVDPSKRKEGSKGCVKLINFSKEETDKAFEFIKKEVHVKRKSAEELVEIYSTGVGGSQFVGQFKEKLNIKLNILAETDCFVAAFTYIIKNMARQDCIQPIYKPAFTRAQENMKMYLEMAKEMEKLTSGFTLQESEMDADYPQMKEDWNKEEPMKVDNQFPCALVMCGSGVAIFLVNEDGTHTVVDGSNRGGRMFLGLGSLLTKAKSFDELIELCKKGNASNVTTGNRQYAATLDRDKEEGEKDLYDLVLENNDNDEVYYCFGETVNKEISDFARADLARALLQTMVLDLVHFVQLYLMSCGIKHVFFCGGFVQYELVRELIYTHWLKRGTEFMFMNPKKGGLIQAHFLTQGHSLGAIGAFMNHKLKWSEAQAPQQ